jgi:ribosomal protein S18 acetylase RimI-like enzyme
VSEAHPARWAIEKLTSRHDLADFDCGVEPLNRFLKKYAGQNAKLGITRTYVAVRPDDNRLQGYYSISSGSVTCRDIPEALRKRLPNYPVPVAHLGRLAVDKEAQGRGLGRLLLMDALERILLAAGSIAIHAVEVQAKDDESRGFYLKYGFVPMLDDSSHLYLPLKAVNKLDLHR